MNIMVDANSGTWPLALQSQYAHAVGIHGISTILKFKSSF
jgi:hypothetical protein